MAKCPSCAHDCPTPFFLNVDAWRWLVCLHCAARLDRKNPRTFLVLPPLLICLSALGHQSHRFALLTEAVIVVAFVVAAVLIGTAQSVRPPKTETSSSDELLAEVRGLRADFQQATAFDESPAWVERGKRMGSR